MSIEHTMTERRPSEVPSPRMEPLARLPVFFALENKRTVVAGDGTGAIWKAELLSAAGACVEEFAPQPAEELLALAAEPPGGPIVVHRRPWDAADFSGAALAVGGCTDDDEAARFAAAARDRHLDRRRCPGVRHGAPRQARGPHSPRLCAVGCGGPELAGCAATLGSVLCGAAPVLAGLHQGRGHPSRPRAQ